MTALCVVCLSGVVEGPSLVPEAWFVHSNEVHTPAPTMAFHTYDIEVTGLLKGGEMAQKHLDIPTCSPLAWVDITLDFDPLQSFGTLPRDCQLVVQDPTGRAVSIGGYDTSYPKVQVSTTWTTAWYSDGVTSPGSYHMSAGLEDTGLRSPGTWTVVVMNAWSAADSVSYQLTVRLKFAAGDSTCTPTGSPSARPVSPPVLLVREELPKRSMYSPVKVTIPEVSLAVTEMDGVKQVPRFTIATFQYTGIGVGEPVERLKAY